MLAQTIVTAEKYSPRKTDIRKAEIRAKFIEKTLTTASPTKAYRELYPNTTAPQEISEGAFRILKTPEVKNSIVESLEKSGLSVGYLNTRLRQLTVAEKQIIFNNQLVPVADNGTSLEAIKTAYKLHKLLEEKNFVNVDARSVNVDVDLPTVEKIDSVISKLDTLNKTLDLTKSGEVLPDVAGLPPRSNYE